MSIGYACHTKEVPDTDIKTCIMKNANDSRLAELIEHNLTSLGNMIDFNIKNDIKLFRISSDIVPFGSSPINKLAWQEIFSIKLKEIGSKIAENNVRVSMHPGQYTVLNSPNTDVVSRAVEDLNYHTLFLDSLGAGRDCKIILHIGGIYNDKAQASERFIKNFEDLSQSVKNRLVIENDDKLYNIYDVIEIGSKLGIPVVFDNLHNKINPCISDKNEVYWINEAAKTWGKYDGIQKIHYAQQEQDKKIGSHSQTIRVNEFLDFYQRLENKDIDIMLEVKDKNLSALKCINIVSNFKNYKGD